MYAQTGQHARPQPTHPRSSSARSSGAPHSHVFLLMGSLPHGRRPRGGQGLQATCPGHCRRSSAVFQGLGTPQGGQAGAARGAPVQTTRYIRRWRQRVSSAAKTRVHRMRASGSLMTSLAVARSHRCPFQQWNESRCCHGAGPPPAGQGPGRCPYPRTWWCSTS